MNLAKLTIVKVELEMRHHNFDHVLGVGGKTVFEFPSIADQHLTCSGLFLQPGRSNAKTLLHIYRTFLSRCCH